MNNADFTLELIRVRQSRYQPVLLLAWLAFLCLQITRPCCEAIALLAPHEHATDHYYDIRPSVSLTATDTISHAHHSHGSDTDITSSEQQEPTPHCEPLSTPNGGLLAYGSFTKTLDEPKQHYFNTLHRPIVFLGVISIAASNQHYQLYHTHPPPYLVTQRLRI